MADKIEVYVRKKEVVAGEAVYGNVSDAVYTIPCGCGATPLSKPSLERVVKTEKVMPEADKTTVDIVKRFADDRGLQVEIFNVGTFTGRLKARQKGVKTTLTIVFGKFRIEGKLAPELLKSKLELAFKK